MRDGDSRNTSTSSQPEPASFSWNNNDTKRHITYENFHPTQYKYQNDNGNNRTRLLQRTSRPELIIFPTPLHTQHPQKQHNNFRIITTTSLTLAEKRVDKYYYAPLLARPTVTTNEPVYTFDKKLQQLEAKMTNLERQHEYTQKNK
jgi:hypothetical protein